MGTTFKSAADLTPTERLERNVVQLLKICPDYDDLVPMSGVLQIGSKRVCPNTPTAYTNGRDEVYGEAFIATLNDAEFRGLILHEALHKMFKHISMYANLAKKYGKWVNAAEDYYINLIIVRLTTLTKGFIKLPEGGLVDAKYTGMSVIEILRDLLDQDGGDDGDDEGDGEGEGEGEGEGGKGGGKAKKGKGGGKGAPDDSNAPDTLDEHDHAGAQELSDAEKKELEDKIDDVVRQAVLTAGKYGKGQATQEVTDMLKPKVDWAAEMRDFMTTHSQGRDHSSWRRLNRRYLSARIALPSSVSESMTSIALCPDMSGSTYGMRDRFFTEALTALRTCTPDLVHLLYWDTKVYGEKYSMEDAESIKSKTVPTGGGGTTVECVPQYMAENSIKPDCAVVLTDGELYGGWGEWTCPVFWLIVDNPNVIPPFGKYVHIDSNDL